MSNQLLISSVSVVKSLKKYSKVEIVHYKNVDNNRLQYQVFKAKFNSYGNLSSFIGPDYLCIRHHCSLRKGESYQVNVNETNEERRLIMLPSRYFHLFETFVVENGDDKTLTPQLIPEEHSGKVAIHLHHFTKKDREHFKKFGFLREEAKLDLRPRINKKGPPQKLIGDIPVRKVEKKGEIRWAAGVLISHTALNTELVRKCLINFHKILCC